MPVSYTPVSPNLASRSLSALNLVNKFVPKGTLPGIAFGAAVAGADYLYNNYGDKINNTLFGGSPVNSSDNKSTAKSPLPVTPPPPVS